jgi:uncharacterized membrane protein YphA (DoxX/SURF4 family)
LLEQGVDPRSARRAWLTHAVARLGLAIIFAYHGLVPKLLLQNPDESAMLRDVGVSPDKLHAIVVAAGFGEILFAACLLAFWRFRWPAVLTIVFAVLASDSRAATGSPRSGAE